MENYGRWEHLIAGYYRFDCGAATVEFTRVHYRNVVAEDTYYVVRDYQADVAKTFNIDEYKYAAEYYNELVPDHAAIPLF